MAKFLLAVLLSACAPMSAYAHIDAVLTMKADGTIPEIPGWIGKVTLKFEKLGTRNAVVQLTVGTKRTTLPPCMAGLIKARSANDIRLAGSWYHEEQDGLPYYIEAQFFDRGQSTSQRFLFSLRDGMLIHYGGYKHINEVEGHGLELRLPPGCKAQYGQVATGE